MNKFRIKPALSALLLTACACALPAAAQAPSGSAKASQLTWQLIDLNPADGVNPEISFYDARYYTEAQYYLYQPSLSERSTGEVAGTTALGNEYASVSASSQDKGASASSRLTEATEGGTALARGHYSSRFRLTPHTGVMFSLLAEVGGATSRPDALGDGTVTFFGQVGDFYANAGSSLFEDDIRSESDALSVLLRGYLHTDAASAEGVLRIDTAAESRKWIPSTPVPEPASAAMLLAGLGIVGMGAARRRRRA